MKTILKYALLFIILLSSFSRGIAQDFTFSQFYEMPLLRNPAIAGIFTGDIRVQSAYRSQWASVTVPYKTMALSTEVKFPVGHGNNYLAAALQLSNDEAGDLNFGRTQILPALNFLKSINDNSGYWAFGVMAGYVQTKYDPTKMTFDDQFQNGIFNSNNVTQQTISKSTLTYFDLSAGTAVSNQFGDNKWYLGLAGYNLIIKQNSSFHNDPILQKPRWVINMGLNLATSEINNLHLYGDYIIQSSNRQALMGILYGHALNQFEDEEDRRCIYLGGFYRWGDAFIPVAKLEVGKISLGVSYDVNVSQLNSASQFRGGFEITGSYKSYLNILNSSKDVINCPKF